MNEIYTRTPGAPLTPEEKQYLTKTEWLVTNGLGGYATGTVGGTPTRVFHGYLISALPSPKGRTMMLNNLLETVVFPDGRTVALNGFTTEQSEFDGSPYLASFRLHRGLPVWTFEVDGMTIEKRVYLPHRQNTTFLNYRMGEGSGSVKLQLRPAINFRGHETPVNTPLAPYEVTFHDSRFEIKTGDEAPLRIIHLGEDASFSIEKYDIRDIVYEIERSRGYIWRGDLWSPGYFCAELAPGREVSLLASTESWEIMSALTPRQAWDAERDRKRRLTLEAQPEACALGRVSQLIWIFAGRAKYS